jgi:hypothetical protein
MLPVTALDIRPVDGEFSPYAIVYVNATAAALEAAHSTSVIELLAHQTDALRSMVQHVDEATAQQGYATGKWTLLESLLHIADCERVFAYRALRVARGDQTPLPGFDQDAWVPLSGAAHRTLVDILTEIDAVRAASLTLAASLDDDAVQRTGTSGGNPVSVRGLLWIIAGHFAHHLEITRTRYLGGA